MKREGCDFPATPLRPRRPCVCFKSPVAFLHLRPCRVAEARFGCSVHFGIRASWRVWANNSPGSPRESDSPPRTWQEGARFSLLIVPPMNREMRRERPGDRFQKLGTEQDLSPPHSSAPSRRGRGTGSRQSRISNCRLATFPRVPRVSEPLHRRWLPARAGSRRIFASTSRSRTQLKPSK